MSAPSQTQGKRFPPDLTHPPTKKGRRGPETPHSNAIPSHPGTSPYLQDVLHRHSAHSEQLNNRPIAGYPYPNAWNTQSPRAGIAPMNSYGRQIRPSPINMPIQGLSGMSIPEEQESMQMRNNPRRGSASLINPHYVQMNRNGNTAYLYSVCS